MINPEPVDANSNTGQCFIDIGVSVVAIKWQNNQLNENQI